ncbi:MAG: hypothetical protein RIG67_24610 [Rhodospirillales bacterium]
MEFSFTWDAIQSFISTIGTALAATALICSIWFFRVTMKYVHYGDIDKNYFDILKIAFDHPYLREPAKIEAPQQVEKYELYALMIWNFLEAVYDRGLKDSYLKKTWYPILEQEGARNIEWLETGTNRDNFKRDFINYVMREKTQWAAGK